MTEKRNTTSRPAVILALAMLALISGAAAVVIALLEVHHALG
jgi:hypothetical protein